MMTFREWYDNTYAPEFEGHALDDYEVAELAWKAAKADIKARLENHDMASCWWDMGLEKDNEQFTADITEIMGN